MTEIQQVCFALDGDYRGHPYYVSGSALVHAITTNAERLANSRLASSVGVFVPGAYGVYPEEHSQGGASPSLGSTLPTVKSYEDLFLFRNAEHPWLIQSRPQAATKTHDIRLHGGEPVYTPKTTFGTPPGAFHERRTVRWYVHAYLNSPDPGVLPLPAEDLSDLAVGGSRNYGYGRLEYVDSQVIDIESLDYSWLEDADGHCVELCSPYVIDSEYRGVSRTEVPWWWSGCRESVRLRRTRFAEQGSKYEVETVDHGQLFEYIGSDPIRTAKNGITRVGPHSKYGFGELRLIPQH